MNFTPTQRSAIEHISGNLQLIACAGSGKTEVVAQRVVSLLRPVASGGAGCTPENIVAFTFTDKAAAELKERIHTRCKQRLGSITGLANMYVGTIHGYCLELLKSEVPEYMKYEVLNEVQQTLFIDRHSKSSGLTQSATLDGTVLKRFVDTKHFVACLGILREDEAADASKLAGNSVLARLPDYESLLHQKGYLDYSGILKEAVHQLELNPQLRARLAEKIKHVIVDEYQDVNPIQESVVRTLHDLGAGICVVGDDDQTIYQWRGSDVQNILNFKTRYPAVQQVRLEENFRSSEGVVTVAREFIKQLLRRLPKEMKATQAQDYEAGDIVAMTFDAPEDEAEYIAQTCQALRGVACRDGEAQRGMSWSDMAILLRSVRRDGAAVMAALDAAGIPYVITGMDNLFQKPEAEAARQLFYFLAGEITEQTLEGFWTGADLGIAAGALKAAIAEAARARDSMHQAGAGQFKVYITLKSIANDEQPAMEVLVDRPEEIAGVTRVAGPFVVEAMVAPVQPIGAEERGDVALCDDAATHIQRMTEVLRQSKTLRLPGNRELVLSGVRSTSDAEYLHAEAKEGDKRVAIVFGPPAGAISSSLVFESAREAYFLKFDCLYFFGFAIEPGARAMIEDDRKLRISATYVAVTPDVAMSDLLKTTRASEIFSITGLPDAKVRKASKKGPEGQALYEVELRGLDLFDPQSMDTDSVNGESVPCWMLDTDYDGLCFYATQVFFPKTSAWDNLQRSLRATFEDSIWQHLAGTVSEPFVLGEGRRVAVKVIDERGNELMRVLDVAE